jgi:hypothetical protein
MESDVRRVIAFIAGLIVSGSNASSLYDYGAGQFAQYSGNVSSTNVAVYDFSSRCHVSGSRSGNKVSLYHFGVNGHIDLTVEKSGSFSGYNYLTSSHFSGSVSGKDVSLYDYGTGTHYQYSL